MRSTQILSPQNYYSKRNDRYYNNNTIYLLRASYKSGTILHIYTNYTRSFQHQNKRGIVSLYYIQNWGSEIKKCVHIRMANKWKGWGSNLELSCSKVIAFQNEENSDPNSCWSKYVLRSSHSRWQGRWGWQFDHVHGDNKNVDIFALTCEALN